MFLKLIPDHSQVADVRPINFPSMISIRIGTFENWAKELKVLNVWIATPDNVNQVVEIANWACLNNFTVRALGHMHNWSPLTVTRFSNDNVVLVDTTVSLTHIQPPVTLASSTTHAVTVQAGTSMLRFLTFLENNGLGLYATPAPGDLTVGGVLAIGGHGTGVPYANETFLDGYAYGTISNLVLSFEAVVWDSRLNKFVRKIFQRSDVEASAFLISLGRTFITEATLMVGSNYRLLCESRTDITTSELFGESVGERSFSALLDQTGRVETVTFPFTDRPWLKVWSIQPIKPFQAREVKQPFNYAFSDRFPETVTNLMSKISKSAWHLTPALGIAQLNLVETGLKLTSSTKIWGWSKNLMLYIKPTTCRYTANGYATLTERSNIQRVVNTFNVKLVQLVKEYQQQGYYPFNGPMEIRATSLDQPIFANSEPPALSAIRPIDGHPEYDVVIWFDILSVPGTPKLNEAMNKLEAFVLSEYNGTYASVRPEWSKGWAYTDNGAWANDWFYGKFVPSTFPDSTGTNGWNWAVQILDKYDPHRIFTNSFIDSLLQNFH